LDTNVISEAMTREPHPDVRACLDDQSAGKRKTALAAAIDEVLIAFAARILPFDSLAAQYYADLALRARAAGQGFPTPDGYIAAARQPIAMSSVS